MAAPTTVEGWMETVDPTTGQPMTLKAARHKVNEAVFGVGYKTDKDGNPIEQGLGSEVQPTQQDIDATKKYYTGADKDEVVQMKELNLAEYREKRKKKVA